jgi:hypothetical protein
VNAFLPAIDKVAEKPFELKEGTNTLDLEIVYDPKSSDAKDAGADAAATDAGADAAKDDAKAAPKDAPKDKAPAPKKP